MPSNYWSRLSESVRTSYKIMRDALRPTSCVVVSVRRSWIFPNGISSNVNIHLQRLFQESLFLDVQRHIHFVIHRYYARLNSVLEPPLFITRTCLKTTRALRPGDVLGKSVSSAWRVENCRSGQYEVLLVAARASVRPWSKRLRPSGPKKPPLCTVLPVLESVDAAWSRNASLAPYPSPRTSLSQPLHPLTHLVVPRLSATVDRTGLWARPAMCCCDFWFDVSLSV